MNAKEILAVVAGYLIGSLSFAVLLVRWKTGKDIRNEGSGNAGATNVLRAHGKVLGLAVAFLDIAKGAAAVGLAKLLTANPRVAAAAGVAAVLGHIFPLFSGFRGGKGVATAVGAFLVLSPLATVACLGVFVVTVAVTRYVSVGSCLAIALLPSAARWIGHAHPAVVVAAAVTAVIIVLKHLDNFKRLARGQERRLGSGDRKASR
ncbi:MAG TPA: glycerol-3-phosphate 1-O-acyltransferase PlsY [Thermoanaerobaculia bacterium]|jgi:glycerol-3-phosphate acyltransferase PlsY|nr:glycerol-3-phosphate 1-O-acyltransferase PlsY [Thermoanaerobaculia bacterium]